MDHLALVFLFTALAISTGLGLSMYVSLTCECWSEIEKIMIPVSFGIVVVVLLVCFIVRCRYYRKRNSYTVLPTYQTGEPLWH